MNHVRYYAGAQFAKDRLQEAVESDTAPSVPDEWLERARSRSTGFKWPGATGEAKERAVTPSTPDLNRKRYDWHDAPVHLKAALCEFATRAGLLGNLTSVGRICVDLTLLGKEKKVVEGPERSVVLQDATPVVNSSSFEIKMSDITVRLHVNDLCQALAARSKS